MTTVDTFRVVPIATNTLALFLKVALDPANKDGVENEFRKELNDFISTNELAKHWQLKLSRNAARRFYNILRKGTLPAFEFQMNTGNILMDGVPVASPTGGQKVTQEMNVQRLSELARARIEALQ